MGNSQIGNSQKYLHNLARTLIGQLGIDKSLFPLDEAESRSGSDAYRELTNYFDPAIRNNLKRFSDQTLGKIVGAGISSPKVVSKVHGDPRFEWETGGRHLLLRIAATVVIIAMVDVMLADEKKGKSPY